MSITAEDTHHSEGDVYADIKVNGFNAESLSKLGEIYQRQGKLDLALAFYGAANDLSDNAPKSRERLEAIENLSNTTYAPEFHFDLVESIIQAKLNEGIKPPITFIEGHEPDNADIEVVEPSHTQNPRREQAFATSPQNPVPHVTYALPAEALVPGQRLKMTFNNHVNGSIEVTLEVEVANSSSSKPTGSAQHHNGANGKGNGTLRAEFHQDGATATISVFSDTRDAVPADLKQKVS